MDCALSRQEADQRELRDSFAVFRDDRLHAVLLSPFAKYSWQTPEKPCSILGKAFLRVAGALRRSLRRLPVLSVTSNSGSRVCVAWFDPEALFRLLEMF